MQRGSIMSSGSRNGSDSDKPTSGNERDQVLRRMLNTPPKPHDEKPKPAQEKKEKGQATKPAPKR